MELETDPSRLGYLLSPFLVVMLVIPQPGLSSMWSGLSLFYVGCGSFRWFLGGLLLCWADGGGDEVLHQASDRWKHCQHEGGWGRETSWHLWQELFGHGRKWDGLELSSLIQTCWRCESVWVTAFLKGSRVCSQKWERRASITRAPQLRVRQFELEYCAVFDNIFTLINMMACWNCL